MPGAPLFGRYGLNVVERLVHVEFGTPRASLNVCLSEYSSEKYLEMRIKGLLPSCQRTCNHPKLYWL